MYKYFIVCVTVFALFMSGCSSSVKNISDLEKYEVKQTTDEVVQDDFIFRLVSVKEEYHSGEVVELYGEIEYTGDKDEITILHSSSAVIFSMKEEARGYEIGFGVNDIGITTILEKGVPYRGEYEKSGGIAQMMIQRTI